MPYDVILEVRISSDNLYMFDRMAERLRREPDPSIELPAGYTEWNGKAVASALLSDIADELEELQA